MTTVTKNSLADLEDRVSQWGDEWADAQHAARSAFDMIRLINSFRRDGHEKEMRYAELEALWSIGVLHERLAGAPQQMLNTAAFLKSAIVADREFR